MLIPTPVARVAERSFSHVSNYGALAKLCHGERAWRAVEPKEAEENCRVLGTPMDCVNVRSHCKLNRKSTPIIWPLHSNERAIQSFTATQTSS